MNIAQLLIAAARTFGDRPAVSVADRRMLTYVELALRASRLAGGLRALPGMAKGDRIVLAMRNCPQYIEIMWAGWVAGLCVVPINAKLHPREFAYIFENTEARIAFVTDDLADVLSPLAREIPTLDRVVCVDEPEFDLLGQHDAIGLQEVAESDPAWLFYTSGTTGRPKGAILTHRNLLAMALRYYADVDQLSDVDTMIHCAPLSHAGGLYSIPHIARASHQVIPASGGFDPAELFDLVSLHRSATFFCAPTMLNRLTDHTASAPVPIENIRTIFYGGAPMYLEDLKRALNRFGPRLWQAYGQGEMPNTITSLSKRMHADSAHPRYEHRLATVGIARTGVEIRVVDSLGHPLPVGKIGEVVARSDVGMSGYWKNPEATTATLRDGWLYTGDLGQMDEDGFLTLKDRSKDVIISGGSNIYPREVEEALMTHSGVLECSVLGRRHPEWGEEVVAFIVLQPGAVVEESDLERACLANIARFKRPKAYFFTDALPKSANGKILKTELRALVTAAALTEESGRQG